MKFIVTPEQYQDWASKTLDEKIEMSMERIRSWYWAWDGQVYVSFSGGKDSTVLLHLVRSEFPDVPALFVNTGLEYPEIVSFVKSTPNAVTVRPKKSFRQVIEKWGYPLVSKEVARGVSDCQNPTPNNVATRTLRMTGVKRDGSINKAAKLSAKWLYLVDQPIKLSNKCCNFLKKEPIHQYHKLSGRKPIIGTMATDSGLRKIGYLQVGCNSFDSKSPRSAPIAFWTEENVWEYLHRFNITYSTVYDMGYARTGCMFCMFGVHLEKGENRFQKMKRTHPRHWKVGIEKLGVGKCLDLIGVDYGKDELKDL